jgi:D-glycero-D-manno-heptose 1,7-bisphosphate phosphatase
VSANQVGSHQDPGLWAERLTTTQSFVGCRCLFLDRDGVIVEESHYLHRVEDVALIDGVPDAIAEANRAGVAVVITTNQAGIGRGYYDWHSFHEVQRFILHRLGKHGARIDFVLACAYHEEGLGPFRLADHPWRKPHCGMLLEAQRILGIDLARSFIIGDKISDLEAGVAAGLSCGALTLTGHGVAEEAKHRDLLARWRSTSAFGVQVQPNAAAAIRSWLQETNVAVGHDAQDER